MKYQEIPVNKIKPDPKQPRKYFDEESIKQMSASIVSNLKKGKVGIINAIEIDKDYMIVTGERRWRAAKLAGLKTIPAKIIEIDPQERYWRQGIENWSSKNMTHMEWADWIYNVLKMMGWKDSCVTRQSFKDKYGEEYIKKIADKLGASKDTIYDHLRLKFEDKPIRDLLEKNNQVYSPLREINARQLEPEIEKRLKDKVLEGTLVEGLTARHLIKAIKEYPHRTDELLNESYSEGGFARNIGKIDRIKEIVDKDTLSKRSWSYIVKKLIDIESVMSKADWTDIQDIDKDRAIRVIENLIRYLISLKDNLIGEGVKRLNATTR